jgi:iron complex outermembrane receptor protein
MLNIIPKNCRLKQLAGVFSYSIFLLNPISAIAAAINPAKNSDKPVLEQVTVTADFRNQTALNSAASITIVGQEKIANRAAQHFEEIIPAIPNFSFAGGTNRARFFQIRGIGERSQFIQPLNTSVGVLIDNVDFSGAASVATLFDVQQVEVLRGPQGTRYGANALAGLLHIKTNEPSDTFATKISADLGQYGHRSLGLMATGPLSDAVAFRIALQQHNSDGYYANAHLARDDTNERDESIVRAKLRIQPSVNWQIDTSLSLVNVDNGYDAFTLDNSRTTLSDQPGRDVQDSLAFSIDSRWLLENVEVQLIAALGRSDTEYSYDEDWTFTGFHPIGYTSFDQYLRDKDTDSLELRVISQEPIMLLDIETDWIIGLYALSTNVDLQRVYTFQAADFFSTNDSTNSAIFFQLDSHITDDVELSTGLRVERRSSQYNDSENVSFDPTETLWGGRLSLKYLLDENTMTYVSLSRGYKAGGFNTDGDLDASLREFGSEYLWEIELGVKANLLDNKLQVRAAMFRDDRRDQQENSSFTELRANGNTEFVPYYTNAAEGTNQGIEIETIWQLSESVEAFANLGLLDAKFDQFINEIGENLSNRDQAHAPNYTYSTGLNFSRNQWQANLSLEGRDNFYFSVSHQEKSDTMSLVNASLAYNHENWQLRLWARNLTDEDYSIRGFGSFGNDPRDGYTTRPFVQFGEPRIIGVTGSYQL